MSRIKGKKVKIMDNSFFILSKQEVNISRFHICTWDIENSDTFIELGIEFSFPADTQEIDFKFVAPFINENTVVKCLLSNLIKDTENSKFIFNDNVKSFDYFDSDKRSGGIITFETREEGEMAILPITIKAPEKNNVSLNIEKPKTDISTFYVRFLLASNLLTLARIKKGIAKTDYIFDFKLNEKRNLPDNVYQIIKKEKYDFCTVNACFCFHVMPNSFNISFVDQNKLKNVRILEVSAFKKYLPEELKTMKEGKYMIVFNKDKLSDAHSFFTIFTKETIGSMQILLAIGTNIICSLLFGFSALRTSLAGSINSWKQIPCEYWIALIILIFLIVYLFFLKRIRNIFNR